MGKPKAIHMCEATLNGQPCRLQHGQPHHKLLRQKKSGLGLPVPIHELADGTTWYIELTNSP